MKLTRHQKNWLKRILIPLFILLTLRGILYYIVTYRFKDIVQLVVKKETAGNYSFNASKIDFSLWKRRIELQDVTLVCNDTLHTNPHYEISIPDVYLRIESWTDILLHQQVAVDSMSVVSPVITTHEHTIDTAKHIDFKPSKIFDLLQKAGNHLNIRTFSLVNATVNYSNNLLPGKFTCSNFNLHIKNFSKKNAKNGNLLSSEDVDLYITQQHWIFPDGVHQLSFNQLHFSGKDQYFELDSCIFHTETTNRNSFLTLSADKIRFTSQQLASIYKNEQLLIDTLICYHPVLHLQTSEPSNAKTLIADTSNAITRSLQQAFRNVNFKYIDVHNGEFMVDERNIYKPTYATRQTNLTIYNLALRPDSAIKVSTDSIRLSLSNIQFYTADSLYQLSIGNFELKNNDVFFRDAYFSPTAHKGGEKDLIFRTPLLLLKNVNLEDLLQKELTASSAELYNPRIIINSRPKNSISIDSATQVIKKKINKSGAFYKTLHELADLISVKQFKIIDGSLHFQSQGKVPLTANLEKLNTNILLNQFLNSDSLINIKRSLPELRAGELLAATPSMQLEIKNYTFKGGYRHNSADEFRLSLKNGSSLRGKRIYWEIFDWDLLNNYKIISVESLRIGELQADIHESNHDNEKVPKKDLPAVSLNRLDIDSLKFFLQTSKKSNIELSGQNLCIDEIRTRENYWDWGNLQTEFKNIAYSKAGMELYVSEAELDNGHEHVLRDVQMRQKKGDLAISVRAPLITIRSDIHSTEPSHLPMQWIAISDPVISMQSTGRAAAHASKKITIPLLLRGTTLHITHADIDYTAIKNRDTFFLKTFADLGSKGLTSFKEQPELLRFDSLLLSLSGTIISKKQTRITIPATTVALNHGLLSVNDAGQLLLESGIRAGWKDAGLYKTWGDSMVLSVKNANGGYEDPRFHLLQGAPFRWKAFLDKAALQHAVVHYRNKMITADAASLNWDPRPEHFNIKSFSIVPNQKMEEVFKNQQWQADYMVIKGDELNIDRIHYKNQGDDTAIHIGRIGLRNLDLLAARDKRVAFKHGVEKPMPTKFIGMIKYPFLIDSLQLHDATITVLEISKITNQQGIIPIEKLNGLIRNITNQPKAGDSLYVFADARLFTNYIRKFNYHESYTDSLSGFRLNFNTSPMVLTDYSQVTTALAAISVTNGKSDTLFAHWVGNKHAAYGRMDFYYDNLQVQLLDKQNPNKKSLVLSVENFLANTLLLNKNNSKYSRVYFERDKEKFIFNYWVKTSLGGMLSSVGIKSNRKYYKQYLKSKGIYSLPSFED